MYIETPMDQALRHLGQVRPGRHDYDPLAGRGWRLGPNSKGYPTRHFRVRA
jgi:hypothetical protein